MQKLNVDAIRDLVVKIAQGERLVAVKLKGQEVCDRFKNIINGYIFLNEDTQYALGRQCSKNSSRNVARIYTGDSKYKKYVVALVPRYIPNSDWDSAYSGNSYATEDGSVSISSLLISFSRGFNADYALLIFPRSSWDV